MSHAAGLLIMEQQRRRVSPSRYSAPSAPRCAPRCTAHCTLHGRPAQRPRQRGRASRGAQWVTCWSPATIGASGAAAQRHGHRGRGRFIWLLNLREQIRSKGNRGIAPRETDSGVKVALAEGSALWCTSARRAGLDGPLGAWAG